MSNFKTARQTDEEVLTSPSSDERMDTGSESFRSQDTPNSVLSSDFEECQDNVLRLQNPEVLRLSDPKNKELNDSLLTKMSNLNISSRPKNLGISPPKFSSTLTLTTNHPLMGLGSPEENYPDVIPKKVHKIDDEKDLSISSIEDERPVGTNGYFYSPQRNTSKNNLYITENFVTADSQILESNTPDKRMVGIEDTPPRRGREGAVMKYIEKNRRGLGQSTPNTIPVDVPEANEMHSTVAEWCESPSHLRSMPNFDLPIEMSSSLGVHNDLDSPDLISSSTQEDRSTYQAQLDPYTGSVVLRPRAQRSPATTRRKILLPPEDDDRCSLDSVSACSMQSDDLPDLPAVAPPSDNEDTKGSKSSTTVSSPSDPIPEYSAAEEFSNERSFITVPRGGALHTCDVKVIEPYRRVLSHGGYDSRGAALIVVGACHLPDTARPDYSYVMDNLFLYVIWTLERLVTDEYVLVYLHGSAGGRRLPKFHWLHECYKLIDRRLRKSLKHLYLVHPTILLRSFVFLTKPFVSSKFFRKLSYVRNLEELYRLVPVEPNAIPDVVKQFDANRR